MEVGQRVKIINKSDSCYLETGIILIADPASCHIILDGDPSRSKWFSLEELALINEPGNIKPGYYWYRDNPGDKWTPVETDGRYVLFPGEMSAKTLEDLEGDFVELIPPCGL